MMVQRWQETLMGNGAILEALATSAALSCLAFFAIEHRTRVRWSGRPVETVLPASPYRATAVVTRVSDRAPKLVLGAALTGVVLGSVAVPGVSYAMFTLHFDGIALSLLPGIGTAAAAWSTGWLFLARAPVAVDAARLTARVSTLTHVALVALALLHVVAARMGWTERESLGYVVVTAVLALAALSQAALLKAAVARHAPAFAWDHRSSLPTASSSWNTAVQ
jgi:hypothetical protein